MTLDFIPYIDPGYFEGSSPKDRLCQLCRGRRAEHEHHAVFKKMGGRKGKARKQIELPENRRYICMICHDAIHMVHAIAADGFCCDKCPRLVDCYYGRRMLGLAYQHLERPF